VTILAVLALVFSEPARLSGLAGSIRTTRSVGSAESAELPWWQYRWSRCVRSVSRVSFRRSPVS